MLLFNTGLETLVNAVKKKKKKKPGKENRRQKKGMEKNKTSLFTQLLRKY